VNARLLSNMLVMRMSGKIKMMGSIVLTYDKIVLRIEPIVGIFL
jgi:hypothetical protein